MDLGLLFGILGTWALIAWSLLLGGTVAGYYDFRSLVLVVGGSVMIMFITHPFRHVRHLPGMLRKALFPQRADLRSLIDQLVVYAERARRDGILSLELATHEMSDPFMTKAVQMAIDGMDADLIEQVLQEDIEHMADRHQTAKSLFDALGKYAPAMGMIGTLIGLVLMLQKMDDPKAIGPGMAVAILTTLYGALIANGICLPISDRLGRRSAEETLVKSIVMRGVLAIQAGDNPRVVEAKLRTFLPISQRHSPRDRNRERDRVAA